MIKKIKVSAPGKLMLFGEHAVVYDHPCIVTAIDQRLQLEIEPSGSFVLDASDVNIKDYKKDLDKIGDGDIPKGAQFVEIAYKNMRQKYPQISGVKISTSSFASTFGFGSSSASTVCTVKALSQLFNLNLTKKEMFDISYKTVLDIQGKGSGFDVAAAIYGGTLYFWTGGSKHEELKIDAMPLIIGYTGVKADTVTLINKVKELADKNPDRVEKNYQDIEEIVELAKTSILNHNWKKVGELMNRNQKLLEQLGVSSEKLDTMIGAAQDNGAYGAKLSGAGGGDCMIAVAPEEVSGEVEIAIEKVAGKIIKIDSNAQGVRVE